VRGRRREGEEREERERGEREERERRERERERERGIPFFVCLFAITQILMWASQHAFVIATK